MPLDPGYRRIERIHQRGVFTDRPPVDDVVEGTLYFATDTGIIYRSNGTIWEEFSSAGGSNAAAMPMALEDIQERDDTFPIPGPPGPIGITGATGAQGNQGPPGLDGIDEISEPVVLPNPMASLIRLKSVTVITPGITTYTVPAGIIALHVKLVGPGGGGGGSDGTTAGVSSGGGGGGYSERIYPSVGPGQQFTCAVGTGGTGGSAGNNAGNPGSANTVFDSGGVAVTGGPGLGGASMATGNTVVAATPGAGGAGSNGHINVSGGRGPMAYRGSATIYGLGHGGNSLLGYGGHSGFNSTGGNGVGPGGGGSGTVSSSGQADQAGGNGADGVIYVYEYGV